MRYTLTSDCSMANVTNPKDIRLVRKGTTVSHSKHQEQGWDIHTVCLIDNGMVYSAVKAVKITEIIPLQPEPCCNGHHAEPVVIPEPVKQVEAPSQAKAATLLADMFTLAIGYLSKLKRKSNQRQKEPMLRIHFRDQRFKVYLSKPSQWQPKGGTLCVKSGGLAAPAENGCRKPVGDEAYIGKWRNGQFDVARIGYDGPYYQRQLRQLTETEQEFLQRLESDPVGFLAECGKSMNRCCYCNQPLTDARSKEVGYGATCAAHWCLPWGKDRTSDEFVPPFSEQRDYEAEQLCHAIRNEPTCEESWMVFADWLEGHRLQRCQMPKVVAGKCEVVLPRND